MASGKAQLGKPVQAWANHFKRKAVKNVGYDGSSIVHQTNRRRYSKEIHIYLSPTNRVCNMAFNGKIYFCGGKGSR